ncbi:glycosyltransferase family 4 protein [Calderihabitans maritimus]|uniref:Group 1 glycosyl transferase n=1 Tax=Calderihabitans maritimus TaxID=1246530 RepID=A0A1Z5HQK1_9FIRM|nr:glycosyltransferase family 4 protein [Calderihabitans maritimus]GAW91591.1 group 1 glycosyl transferase [Calderihabitans maritimus]
MRVLMLTWEYPPKSVGGLARHVEDLAAAIPQDQWEVHVLTCGEPHLPTSEEINGVYIHRAVPYQLSTPDFITWSLQFNITLLEYAINLLQAKEFDLIHAHDWLVAYVARALKHAYRLPLVATIHATEAGRNHGLHNDVQRFISSVEWWLTYEAWKVIVCSQHMKQEVHHLFQLPLDKIEVIPNGVNPERFKMVTPVPGFRERYARPEEKIVFFVGRLVREKGVQVLLEAVPRVLRSFPQTKFVIAGTGPMEAHLKYTAGALGIEHKVYFAGYIDDETRNRLYDVASIAVFPSLYEPFGIVALEGMAAGTPVVVSDTGGLSEIVEHEVNGLKALPGNADSLADQVLRLLHDENLAARLKSRALQQVKTVYNWQRIAEATAKVYREVRQAYERNWWPHESRPLNRLINHAMRLFNPRWLHQNSDRHQYARYTLVDQRVASIHQYQGRRDW